MKSKSNIFILTLLLLFGSLAFIISIDTFFRNQSATKDLLRIQETKHLLINVQTALEVQNPELIYESAHSLKVMSDLPFKGEVESSWKLLNKSISTLNVLNSAHLERVDRFDQIQLISSQITSEINQLHKTDLRKSQSEDLNYLELILDANYKTLKFIYSADENVQLTEEAVTMQALIKESQEFVDKLMPNNADKLKELEQKIDLFLGAELDYRKSLKDAKQKIQGLEIQVNELFQSKVQSIEELNRFAILGLLLSLIMTSFGLFLLLKKLEKYAAKFVVQD